MPPKLGTRPALTLATVKLLCIKTNVFGLTLVFFGLAIFSFSFWNTPQNRYAGLSYVWLAVGIASSGALFLTPFLAETVGLIPYQRYRAYLCLYRLSFIFFLPGLLLIFVGYGRFYALGTKAREHELGVRLEEIKDQYGLTIRPGDYFRVVDGFVSTEQTRIMAYTRGLHPVRDGDELYETRYKSEGIGGTNKTVSWSDAAEGGAESTPAPKEPNLPTQYHQVPPPWLTIDTEPFTDVEETMTLAPAYAQGENCLERPPPTNRVCYERNKILAFALKPSPGFCRQMGSITCKVDWEMLQIHPSYGCAPAKQDPDRYPNVETDFDHGLCARVILPQGNELVLASHGLKRFKQDGWEFEADIDKIMFLDVSEDACIAQEEQCRLDYDNYGFVGGLFAGVAAALVVLAYGMDVYHDYLMRQLMFLDEKELRGTRMIRHQLEADKLRQMELAKFEQTMRLEELHKTLHAQTKIDTKKDEAPGQDGMFKPLPGAVPPVK
jgi:hypothetical protein